MLQRVPARRLGASGSASDKPQSVNHTPGHTLKHWCGEMAELEGRECIINTPLHLSRHPKGIFEKE